MPGPWNTIRWHRPICRLQQSNHMSILAGKTDQQLQEIADHTSEVFKEVADVLDSQPEVTAAVGTLLQSESTMEDFMTLFVSQPKVTETLLMSSLSSLINAHTLVTVRNEQTERRNRQ